MFKMSSSPGAPRTQPLRRSTRLISILSLLLLPAFLLLLRETSLQAGVTHAAGLGSVPAQADRFGQKDGRKEAPPSVEQPGGRNSQVPQGACSQTQIDEGFDDITTLSASGWFTQNNSSPQGVTGWFQGNPEAFPAHSGATNSYVGANFNNTTGSNTISNWLLSPQVSLQNGDMFVFWTRTSEDNPLPDRLEVRLSTAGASTNVGDTSTSVGDFTVLLRSINPNLEVGGYPEVWTQFVVTLNGFSGTESGRIAFRYYVTDGGPAGDNSNYIGIDTVAYYTGCSPQATPTATACPVQFNDVPSSSPFYANVRCMACRGVISGYGCGAADEPCPGSYFRPGVNVTRAQISKMVAIAAGLDDEPAGARKFQDVPEGSTFYQWVQQLANSGAISGYACGGANPANGEAEPCVAPGSLAYFRPNNNTTRGQLTKIVSTAAALTGDPGSQKFADVPPNGTFFEWVQRLSNRGVVGGYSCGGTNPATGAPEPCDAASRPYFRVNNNVTRGQIAKIAAETFFPNCQTPARSIK